MPLKVRTVPKGERVGKLSVHPFRKPFVFLDVDEHGEFWTIAHSLDGGSTRLYSTRSEEDVQLFLRQPSKIPNTFAQFDLLEHGGSVWREDITPSEGELVELSLVHVQTRLWLRQYYPDVLGRATRNDLIHSLDVLSFLDLDCELPLNLQVVYLEILLLRSRFSKDLDFRGDPLFKRACEELLTQYRVSFTDRLQLMMHVRLALELLDDPTIH